MGKTLPGGFRYLSACAGLPLLLSSRPHLRGSWSCRFPTLISLPCSRQRFFGALFPHFIAMSRRCMLFFFAVFCLTVHCSAVLVSPEVNPLAPLLPSNTSLRRDANHFIMSGYQITSFRSEDCNISLPNAGPVFQYVFSPLLCLKFPLLRAPSCYILTGV